MAIIAQDNFDSYSNGTSLNGQTGGSGFVSAWSVTGTFVTQNSVAYSSPLAAFCNSGYSNVTRNFPNTDKVFVDFRFRTDNLAGEPEILVGSSSGSIRLQVKNTGVFGYFLNGVFFSTSQNISAATWYRMGIYMDRLSGDWKIYVNDVVIASGNTSFGAGQFYYLYFIAPGVSSVVYFDDLKVHDNNPYSAPSSSAQPQFLLNFIND